MDRLLGEHGLPGDSKLARREFAARMKARRAAELDGEWKAVRRGWCLGDKKFCQALLEEMRSRSGPNHGGTERRETDEAWAAQVLARELKARRWTTANLTHPRKGHPQKVKIRQLRQETTMTLQWIAERLNMGTAGSLANLLRKTARKQ